MKTKSFKNLIVLMLALVLVIPMFIKGEADAASKPTLNYTDLTIGLGSYGGQYFDEKETRYCIQVENGKKGATYTFTSSNKKVAKVKGKGNVGYITGKKAGEATITVKQKLKGKTTTIGKCVVTVKNAELSVGWYANERGYAVGTDIIADRNLDTGEICGIDYYNPKATYKYETNSEDLKIEHIVLDDVWGVMGEEFQYCAQKYTAKKAGTYKVTLKETYKKKTRTVGEFEIIIRDTEIKDSLELYMGEEISIYDIMICGEGIKWIAESKGDSIEAYEGLGAGAASHYVRGVKAGTEVLHFYYATENYEKGDLIGSCEITVKETVITNLEMEEKATVHLGSGEVAYLINYTLETEPSYMRVPYTVVSADESIIKFEKNQWGYWEYTALKPGVVTITVTIGSEVREVEVTVLDEEFEIVWE